MTQHEYQEMLRAALKALMRKAYSLGCHEYSLEYYDAAKALATPPPTKLKPMSEAPRDGKPILVCHLSGLWWAVAEWSVMQEWDIGDRTYDDDELGGWTELPEVSE